MAETPDAPPGTETEPVFPNAPRCTAQSKRTGLQCRAPALSGTNRCRFHSPWKRKRARSRATAAKIRAANAVLDAVARPALTVEQMAQLEAEEARQVVAEGPVTSEVTGVEPAEPEQNVRQVAEQSPDPVLASISRVQTMDPNEDLRGGQAPIADLPPDLKDWERERLGLPPVGKTSLPSLPGGGRTSKRRAMPAQPIMSQEPDPDYNPFE